MSEDKRIIQGRQGITYRMSDVGYAVLLKRCKGNKAAARDEIMRGLNIPLTHKFTHKIENDVPVVVSVRSKHIEMLDDITTYETVDDDFTKQNQRR